MSISILIPTLNEEKYIANCIESLLISLKNFNDYEIIIIDGESDDDTMKIVNNYIKNNPKIKAINNSKKTAPAALNLGLKEARFDIVMRCDAHAIYPNNYVKNNFDLLIQSDEKTMNVGGYIHTISAKNSLISNSIAYVLSSPFGVGNSNFRTGLSIHKEVVKADTVPFGCYKKKIFELIGNFNENEPANEDLEFNYRIAKNGYKVLISNSIHSYYCSRSNFKDFIKQAIRNGIITTYNKNFSFRSSRHYVPLLFFLFLFFGLANKITYDNLLVSNLFKFGVIAYLIFIITGTVFIILKKKVFYSLFYCPLLFFALHFFYGFGSFIGFFKNKNSL
jgi:glycosyltransferase involved in cell wall biosynthesis